MSERAGMLRSSVGRRALSVTAFACVISVGMLRDDLGAVCELAPTPQKCKLEAGQLVLDGCFASTLCKG